MGATKFVEAWSYRPRKACEKEGTRERSSSLEIHPVQDSSEPLSTTTLTFGCRPLGACRTPPSLMSVAGSNLGPQTRDQPGPASPPLKNLHSNWTTVYSTGHIDQWQPTSPQHLLLNIPSIGSLATGSNKLVVHHPPPPKTTNSCDDSICL